MRVLHVIAPPAARPRRHWRGVRDGMEIEIALCAGAIRAAEGHHHRVVCLGGDDARAFARDCVPGPIDALSTPGGVGELASRRLERLAAARGPFDAVQCWGAPAWRAARGTSLAGRTTVCTLDERPVPDELEIDPLALAPLLRPPDRARRDSVRQALGVPDAVPLLALLGEPAERIDAWRFVFSIGLVEVCDLPIAAVVSTRSLGYRRAWAFHRRSDRSFPLTGWSGPMHAILPACDLAWICGSPEPDAIEGLATRLWATLAHRAGVPVVGPEERLGADLHPADLRNRLAAPLNTNPSITEGVIAAIERGDLGEIGARVARHAGTQAEAVRGAVGLLEGAWSRHGRA